MFMGKSNVDFHNPSLVIQFILNMSLLNFFLQCEIITILHHSCLVTYFTYFLSSAYSLKHSRDLIRAISKKVKGNPFYLGRLSLKEPQTAYDRLPNTTPMHRRIRTGRSSRFSVITPRSETKTAVSLPPLKQQYVLN